MWIQKQNNIYIFEYKLNISYNYFCYANILVSIVNNTNNSKCTIIYAPIYQYRSMLVSNKFEQWKIDNVYMLVADETRANTHVHNLIMYVIIHIYIANCARILRMLYYSLIFILVRKEFSCDHIFNAKISEPAINACYIIKVRSKLQTNRN